MSLSIFGTPASLTFHAICAADEVGLGDELASRHCGDPEAKSAGHRAIDPNGTIPAVLNDGLSFLESHATNLHLTRKHGKLRPTDVEGEGRALRRTPRTAVVSATETSFRRTSLRPEPAHEPELARETTTTAAVGRRQTAA